MGRPGAAEAADDGLLAQSGRIKKTLRERAFDGTWFRDNDRHPDVTETCQYYAFFHGIATPESHRAFAMGSTMR